MRRISIILTLIILTVIPFSYAANDFAYNRLYDGNQIIDGLNYSINVNHSYFSDNWNTNIGVLSGVNATQHTNLGGLLNINTTWLNEFGSDIWCKLTGCTMQGDFLLDGNDVIDVGNLEVEDNVSVGGKVNITGNVIIQDRLFVGIDPSETSAVINPGDAVFNGNVIVGDGVLASFPKEFGQSLTLFSNGDDDPEQTVFYIGANANLNTATGEFCDYTNSPFFDNSTELFITIIISNELGLNQIPLEIIIFENSSCVFVELAAFGDENVTSLSGISYLTGPAPRFTVLDKGQITANPEIFRLNFRNTNSQSYFQINSIANNDDIASFTVDSDQNGFLNMINMISSMRTSKEVNGSVQINALISGDFNNQTTGQYTGISLEIVGEGTNISKTGIDISSQFDTIITVAQEEKISRAYYDDTSTTTDITNQLNNSDTITALFENNASIVYVGNIINFTSVSFSVSTEASTSISPELFYCNSNNEWELLIAADGTGGFTHSGTISFGNPTNRGTCNQEIDGTPFADTTNHTYIAIQRTEDILAVTPTVVSSILFIRGSEILYGNPEGVTGADRTFVIANEADLEEGEASFVVTSKDAAGQRRINLALVSRQNNSGAINYNSFGLFPDNDLSIDDRLNLSMVTNIVQRWSNYGIQSSLDYFSAINHTSFASLFGIESQQLILHNELGNGVLDGAGLFNWEIENTDEATFSLGSIRNLIPVNFTTGFLPGDPFPIFLELFLGGLGIFSNDQVDIGNWNDVAAPGLCDNGQCARATGAGVGDVSMTTTFSTLNVNETQLSFVYSLFNLIGAGELTVTINNATTSEELFSDTTDNIALEPELILLSEDWSNQTTLNLTFRCDLGSANKPTRQCYVDTVKMNGTFTANTTALVNSFDAEFCASPTRGTDGRCTNSIYFAAENNTWFASPSINGTGASGGVFSGSGTANTITKFLAPTTLGDSNIIDNGTLITLGTDSLMQGNTNQGGNDIYNVSNINITNNLTISSLTNGSVLFAGANGLVSEDNSNFFWDEVNKRMGIGTDTPANMLHIFSSDAISNSTFFYLQAPASSGVNHLDMKLHNTNANSANRQARLAFQHGSFDGGDGGVGGYIDSGRDATAGGDNGKYNNAASSDSYLSFATATNNVNSEKMRILSSGNVGIGETTPLSKLHIDTGATTNIGQIIKGVASQSADLSQWRDSAGNVLNVVDASGNVGIGTTSPSYPLEVRGTNASDQNITIWSEGNISATGFITRTSIFDKGKNVWDYIKDADYFKDGNDINESRFYGYVGKFEITDYDRPELNLVCESKIVLENYTYIEEVCEYEKKLSNNYIYVCENISEQREREKQNCSMKSSCKYIYQNATDDYEQVCEDVEVCISLTEEICNNQTIYPYKKFEEGVELGREIDVLRQGMFLLKEENILIKSELCKLGSLAFC